MSRHRWKLDIFAASATSFAAIAVFTVDCKASACLACAMHGAFQDFGLLDLGLDRRIGLTELLGLNLDHRGILRPRALRGAEPETDHRRECRRQGTDGDIDDLRDIVSRRHADRDEKDQDSKETERHDKRDDGRALGHRIV